jgi:hypothetical protein
MVMYQGGHSLIAGWIVGSTDAAENNQHNQLSIFAEWCPLTQIVVINAVDRSQRERAKKLFN